MIWNFLVYLAFPGHTAKFTTLKFTTQMQGWLEGEYLRKQMQAVFSVYSIFLFNGELWAGRTWNDNILLVIQVFWQIWSIVWMVTLFIQRSKIQFYYSMTGIVWLCVLSFWQRAMERRSNHWTKLAEYKRRVESSRKEFKEYSKQGTVFWFFFLKIAFMSWYLNFFCCCCYFSRKTY